MTGSVNGGTAPFQGLISRIGQRTLIRLRRINTAPLAARVRLGQARLAHLFTGRRFGFGTGLSCYRARFRGTGHVRRTGSIGHEDQMNL